MCLTCGKKTKKKFCKSCTDKAARNHIIMQTKIARAERFARYDCDPYDYNISENDMYI